MCTSKQITHSTFLINCILFSCLCHTAHARSVYVITDGYSTVKAYNIQDGQIVEQATAENLANHGGAVGLVPDLDSDEELKLAPIDATDLEEQKRLMDETHKLTQDILQEREVPGGPAGAATSAPEISDKELTKNIIVYLRLMANGELDEAQRTADLIAPYGTQAIKILDRIALSEMPEPELADIPQQVLSGFIRNLRTRIS